MGSLAGNSTTTQDDAPVTLTLKNADALAERLRALLDGRSLVVNVIEWTRLSAHLVSVGVGVPPGLPRLECNRGLVLKFCVHDRTAACEAVYGLTYFERPQLTFRADGITVNTNGGYPHEITITG